MNNGKSNMYIRIVNQISVFLLVLSYSVLESGFPASE